MAHEDSTTPDATETLKIAESHGHWNVWKTADRLEDAALHFYPTLTPRVVSILRQWATTWAGQPEWQSLLNKSTLLHEIEESIVAIYLYLERTSTCTKGSQAHVVVDVCGGKGLFSFLLSYLRPPNVDHIILLEKATAINWQHIGAANAVHEAEGRPKIIMWPDTNLHDYDKVLNRLIALELPVALTGIHLCKQLGPSFCGLVNGLGPERCLYACLAPCCLPRAVTAQKNNNHQGKLFAITIQLEEGHQDRETRLDYMERRERLRRKPVGGPCFFCHDENHGLQECSVLPTRANPEQQIEIRQAHHAVTMPCWNCLEYGHYKRDCPVRDENATKNKAVAISWQAPTLTLNVSSVLQTSRPFTTYCHLLAGSLQNRDLVDVVETELENTENHQDGNWNSQRKAIFIICS
jgi:hypothetical protein